jgi:hypothetical protein
MNYILSVFALFALILTNPAYSEEVKHETQQVCKDKTDKAGKPVMDKKTGKPAQECKQVKMHKKLEVTK